MTGIYTLKIFDNFVENLVNSDLCLVLKPFNRIPAHTELIEVPLMFLAKDFIETSEGLVFAVVENGSEQDKVLCFLRYILINSQWKKVSTIEANQFLTDKYPHYLYYSSIKQAHLHAVAFNQISVHHQPGTRLKRLLATHSSDHVENDLANLCLLLEKQGVDLNEVGVTGSILIAAQNNSSDIDLVFYSRLGFVKARRIVKKLIEQGDCLALKESDWQDSYQRRQCELSYSEYLWHEKRKYNKALFNQRKFDISFVMENDHKVSLNQFIKLKPVNLKVQVVDDTFAFDYPAEFLVKHHQIKSIVSYTATYTGQVQAGEWVEVSGFLEQSDDGCHRIVVGSSREAKGEYIKVINE